LGSNAQRSARDSPCLTPVKMGQQLSPAMLATCQSAATASPRSRQPCSPSRRSRGRGVGLGFGLPEEEALQQLKPSFHLGGSADASSPRDFVAPRRNRRNSEELSAWSQLGMSAM